MLANHIRLMPPAVQQSILSAGWKPGVVRNHSVKDFGLNLFPLAVEILGELSGIEVRPMKDGLTVRALRLRFDPSIVYGYEEEVRMLGRALCVPLFPLADVGNGIAILLLAESGELLLLGYAAPGVYLAGKTFEEGITAILQGCAMVPLLIENDPGRVFHNPDLQPSDGSPINVPIGGLSSIA